MSSFASWFRVAGQLSALAAATQQLLIGQAKIMATMADIKAAEQDEGARLAKLESLTDSIYQKLQASGAVDDPAVQEVLDLIASHNKSMDDTMARDTAASASGDQSGSASGSGTANPPTDSGTTPAS